MCAKVAFLHLIVPHADLRMIPDDDDDDDRGARGDEGRSSSPPTPSISSSLTSYRFGTGKAEHLFCRVCGVKSFYQPRSHPDCWSVNARCLDAVMDLDAAFRSIRYVDFDGRSKSGADFEAAVAVNTSASA